MKGARGLACLFTDRQAKVTCRPVSWLHVGSIASPGIVLVEDSAVHWRAIAPCSRIRRFGQVHEYIPTLAHLVYLSTRHRGSGGYSLAVYYYSATLRRPPVPAGGVGFGPVYGVPAQITRG